MPVLRPRSDRSTYPVHSKPLSAEHHSRSKRERSLHRASFLRQVLKQAVRLPLHRLPPAFKTRMLGEPEKDPLKLCAFEEGTRPQLDKTLPPTQLDLDKIELEDESCNQRVQLRKALEAMHQAVHSLDAKLAKAKASKQDDNNNNNTNNNDNNNNTTTHNNNQHNNHTNNNNNNNDNNNSKDSRESSLQSLDLDKTNPGSKADLDGRSLGSFTQTLGDESSPPGLDHQEASLSFNNLGHNKTMTIGLSLGSFSQNNNNKDGQEGKRVNTASSFDSQRAKLGQQKPGKRVTFGMVTLKAYNSECELQNENSKRTTCWDSFQQENAMQQQTAEASGKELQKACPKQQQNNSLGREEQTLGNIQQACRCPSNMNTSNLGTTR